MILSVHSSAEEMVASVTVNDPGKCFAILRKTIQLIQSLKKKKRQIGNEKVIFQKKEERREQNRHNTEKQNFRREEGRKYSYMRN